MQKQVQFISTGDVATDIVDSLHAPGELGQEVEIDGKVYRRVKVAASNTGALGKLAVWSDRDAFTVRLSATTDLDGVCGIFLGAPAENQYCWIQKKGVATVLYDTSQTVTPDDKGNAVINDASAAGVADCVSVATMRQKIGYTLGAASGSTYLGSIFVDVP